MAKKKEVQSINTNGNVTTITYTDGSTETRRDGGPVQVGNLNNSTVVIRK